MRLTRVMTAAALVCVGVAFAPSAGCAKELRAPNPPYKLTADDWYGAAGSMVRQMNDAGVLSRYRNGSQPAVVALGDFKNRTTNVDFTFDRQFMYKTIEQQLINSGQAVVNMDIAGTGGTVDGLLQRIQELENDPNYNPATYQGGLAGIPNLILYGDITADTSRDKKAVQYDYLLDVRLIDVEQRAAVWSGLVPLYKRVKNRG